MSRIDAIKDPEILEELKDVRRRLKRLEGNIALSAINRTSIITTDVAGNIIFIQSTEPPLVEGARWLKIMPGAASIMYDCMRQSSASGGSLTWQWAAETT